MDHKTFILSFLLISVSPVWAATATPAPQPVKAVHLPAIRLFTDKKDCDYTHPYPPETSKSVVFFKNKKRWVDFKLNGSDKSGIYLGIGRKTLSLYLEKGALQFYIRGNKGGETLSGVGFTMAKDAKHKFNFATTVPLGDYCAVTTKWQTVTIPLSEFPLTGKYTEIDETARHLQKIMNQTITHGTIQVHQCRFDWDQVIEVKFEHTANDDPDTEIQVSNVVILPEYKLKTVIREKEAIQ